MNISRYIRIALFFTAIGTAGAGYIVLSSDGLNSFNTKTYEVIIPDATGLSTRSKVYLAGVVVGKIKEIVLTGNEARLKISLLKDVEVRQDAKLSRKSSSILGTSVLALDPGLESSSVILPGTRIGADTTTGDMSAIFKMIQEMGGQISGLLDEFQKNQLVLLSVSLETFNSIAGKIDSQSDAQLEKISRILESTALITERTEHILGRSGDDIEFSITEIRGALSNIRDITGEIREGRGNIGRSVYDDRLYESVVATAEKAGEAAEKLKEALGSINKLVNNVDGVVATAGEIVEKAAGLGIQVDANARYDFISRQTRAAASLRLDPRSGDRWYRIGVSSSPDGISSRTVRETIGSNGAVFREDSTETRYSFAFDAELARRFGMFTIRGGLLESSAGFGLDIQPLNWAALSGELFDFKTGALPNFRSTLTFYPFFDSNSDKPWNWLYFRGGINNVLSGNRDFFIGGGIRFADREVKGLIGMVPAFSSLPSGN
jgi:phospholipid/cholesterol/gamma-HCH transport system substrate-binding protein